MPTPKLTRRHALFAGAALPFAAAMVPLMQARPAQAAAGMLGATPTPFNRFTLGGFEVTTLLAGTRTSDKPQETFGLNVTPEEFAAASAAAFIASFSCSFTCVCICLLCSAMFAGVAAVFEVDDVELGN